MAGEAANSWWNANWWPSPYWGADWWGSAVVGTTIVDGCSGTNGDAIDARVPDTTSNGAVWAASTNPDIQSNQMRLGYSFVSTDYAFIDLNTQNADFQFTFNPGGAQNKVRVFWARDTLNYGTTPDEGYGFLFDVGSASAVLSLKRYVGGVEQTLGAGNAIDLSGLNDTYTIRVTNDKVIGSVAIYIDSSLYLQETDVYSTDALGTRIGFTNSGSTSNASRIDAISGSEFVTAISRTGSMRSFVLFLR